MSLKEIAAEVLAIVRAGRYEYDHREVCFQAAQESAIAHTRLYRPAELDRLRSNPSNGRSPSIAVVDGTTQEVAHQMTRESEPSAGALALLNFASARNPGGGFVNGAMAQEEDLCRCSGLYPCLLLCMEYYQVNRAHASLLYTDHAIFSPRVPFFKTHGTGELLPAPFLVSVITAPAPNSGPFLREHPDQVDTLESTFLRRWENLLCIARDQGIGRLLLGAWGCGAFRGDPVMAASTAKIAINRFGSAFDKIVFAIPGTGQQSQANLETFRETFAQN